PSSPGRSRAYCENPIRPGDFFCPLVLPTSSFSSCSVKSRGWSPPVKKFCPPGPGYSATITGFLTWWQPCGTSTPRNQCLPRPVRSLSRPALDRITERSCLWCCPATQLILQRQIDRHRECKRCRKCRLLQAKGIE